MLTYLNLRSYNKAATQIQDSVKTWHILIPVPPQKSQPLPTFYLSLPHTQNKTCLFISVVLVTRISLFIGITNVLNWLTQNTVMHSAYSATMEPLLLYYSVNSKDSCIIWQLRLSEINREHFSYNTQNSRNLILQYIILSYKITMWSFP